MDLKLKQSHERGMMKETENQEKLEALLKEKKELLELSMQRGKILQVSPTLNTVVDQNEFLRLDEISLCYAAKWA